MNKSLNKEEFVGKYDYFDSHRGYAVLGGLGACPCCGREEDYNCIYDLFHGYEGKKVRITIEEIE